MTDKHASDCLSEQDEVNRLHEQLEAERRALEASQVVWQHQREHQEQQLLERASELHLREREVEQQWHLLDRERQAWEQRTADLAPQMAGTTSSEHDASSRSEKASASPMPSSSEAPSDTALSDTGVGTDYDPIAALERLRHMVEIEEKEDEPQDEAIQPIMPDHQSDAPAAHVLENVLGNVLDNVLDNEESIDDYMSKLMSRVNGKSERIGPDPITPVPSVADSPATSAVTHPAETEPERPGSASPKDATSSPESKNPAEPKRRSARPDLTTNLTTMREVANISARTAIDTSARKKRIHTAVQSSAIGAAAFGTAGYMIFGLSDLLKIVAVFAVCVAVAVLLKKYRNSAPIAHAADWAKRQSLRWRKLTPQGNADKLNDTESNQPSDAAGSPEPTSQNSTEEEADDNSRIDSH